MVLEQRRKHAEDEAKTKALLDSWDEERIKGDADIALMKQIKEEMQEYTQEKKMNGRGIMKLKGRNFISIKERREKCSVVQQLSKRGSTMSTI